MLLTHLFAITPATLTWSPKVALVMIVCNVIAIGIGKATIKYPNVGAQLPNASFFGGMSHAALLGTTSLGPHHWHWCNPGFGRPRRALRFFPQ
jgi:photosystem I subunit 10